MGDYQENKKRWDTIGIHGLVSSYSEGFSFKFLAVLVSMYCSIVAR
jgi:hypothetical protein